MLKMKSSTVCVTGASGYIASWIVKMLLERGYNVRATVRDLNDPKKIEHLLALDGAKERLRLVKADLLEEGSFDEAVDGCDGVFHTASPYFLDIKDPQTELLDPALKGTLNVLGSCARTPSVRRVVSTSSIAAMSFNGKPWGPDAVIDETWWSSPKICTKAQQWYALSKTLAEEAAWKFVTEKGIDMVSINPVMVIGPLLQPTLNTSCDWILNLINGSETYPNMTMAWVNVKDVALVHVLAYEDPSANGRYCVSESNAHFSETVQILRKLYPDIKLTDKCADDNPIAPASKVSQARAKSLGIEFISFEQTLQETVESLKEKNFFKQTT